MDQTVNVMVIQNNQELNNISLSKLQYLPYTADVTDSSFVDITEGSTSTCSYENILTDQFEVGGVHQHIKKDTTTTTTTAATTVVPSNSKALSSEELRLQIEENMHKYYIIYNIHTLNYFVL